MTNFLHRHSGTLCDFPYFHLGHMLNQRTIDIIWDTDPSRGQMLKQSTMDPILRQDSFQTLDKYCRKPWQIQSLDKYWSRIRRSKHSLYSASAFVRGLDPCLRLYLLFSDSAYVQGVNPLNSTSEIGKGTYKIYTELYNILICINKFYWRFYSTIE
jgi:hypothetical protein